MTITRQELIERLKKVNSTNTKASVLAVKALLLDSPAPILDVLPAAMELNRANRELFAALTGDELTDAELVYLVGNK